MAEKIDPSDPANGEVLKVMMAMEIAKIKQSSPGLVAKQVHAELVKDARFTNISVSEVKRACSKIAKAEVAAGGRTLTPQEAAGTAGAAMITNEQADAMVKGTMARSGCQHAHSRAAISHALVRSDPSTWILSYKRRREKSCARLATN